MDVPWKYLNFFLDDDKRLADIGQRYARGDETMLTGHVKGELIGVGSPTCILGLGMFCPTGLWRQRCALHGNGLWCCAAACMGWTCWS